MMVTSVVKPLLEAVISKYINEHIQERNILNVSNVVKPLQEGVISRYRNEHILEVTL